MAKKKASVKTAKPRRASKPAAKKVTKKAAPVRKQSTFVNVAEYLKLGESYTSLVLGIIAVVIGTVLLLSVIHNRQGARLTPEVTPTIAQSQAFAISPTGVFKQPTLTEGMEAAETSPANPVSPASPTQQPGKELRPRTQGFTYTVQSGDNLWTISEKVYGNGYNWVDIAKANGLSNPDGIHAGNKLKTPVVRLPDATVQTEDEHLSRSMQESIRSNKYTIVPGDNLWGIALRAYGDPYQWVKIAKANNLTDPNVIHAGNVLKIPRG